MILKLFPRRQQYSSIFWLCFRNYALLMCDNFICTQTKNLWSIDHVLPNNTLFKLSKNGKRGLNKIAIIFIYSKHIERKILTFFSRSRRRRRFFNTTITINNKHKMLLVLDARLCGMLWVCVFARTQNDQNLFELSAQALYIY